MPGNTGGNRGPRSAARLAVVAAVAVMAAACGGHVASSGGSGSAAVAQELAFARCMRGHGVPDFPDPNATGGFTLRANSSGVPALNTSQAASAYGTCRHLLPGGGPSLAEIQARFAHGKAAIQRANLSLLAFARCMHSHGFPSFPEPPVTFKSTGINVRSPQFLAAAKTCQHLLPAGSTVP